MKILMLVLIAIIFSATVVQLKDLYFRDKALTEDENRAVKKVDALAKENVDLQAAIQYLGDPQNLAKEARKELNYGVPGERLMVVIPKKRQ